MTTRTAPRILEIDYGRLLAARPVRYAVAGMTIALFGSLELLVPDSGPRLAIQACIVLALVAGLTLWLRVNRVALHQARDRHRWPVDVLVPVIVIPAGAHRGGAGRRDSRRTVPTRPGWPTASRGCRRPGA